MSQAMWKGEALKGEFVEVDVTTDTPGAKVMCDRYWLMRNGRAVAYLEGGTLYPQANHAKSVIEYLQRRLPKHFEGCEIRGLSVAYFPKWGIDMGSEEHTCPDCGGNGQYHDDRCSLCQGSGVYVWLDEAPAQESRRDAPGLTETVMPLCLPA